MPFRERAKALFKTRARSDRDTTLSKTSTQGSSRERWPSNVYKPGEAMPRPKYRAEPKPEHTEKLQAFSFGESWRKRSFQSQHSPMGTRLPSRRNSSSRAPTSRRNSIFSLGARRSTSDCGRTNSVTSVDTSGSGYRKRGFGIGGGGGGAHKDAPPPLHAAVATRLSTEVEAEGDDDVRNGDCLSPDALAVLCQSLTFVVGLSRANSQQQPRPISSRGHTTAPGPLRPMATASDHQPFTEHDLALALKRSHLAVPAN